MKVGELLNILNDYEDDVEVLVASDEEWNKLRSLYSVDTTAAEEDEYEFHAIHPDDILDHEGDFIDVLVLS